MSRYLSVQTTDPGSPGRRDSSGSGSSTFRRLKLKDFKTNVNYSFRQKILTNATQILESCTGDSERWVLGTDILYIQERLMKIQGRFREDLGKIQGKFREDLGKIQGRFREDLGKIQERFREDLGKIQERFREDLEKIQERFREGRFREDLEKIQRRFRKDLGKIQERFREDLEKIQRRFREDFFCIIFVNKAHLYPCYVTYLELICSWSRSARVALSKSYKINLLKE